MPGRLDGKVAIVTGGGRGIGRAEAMLLAKEGAAVVVNDLGGALDGSGQDARPADEVVAGIKANGGRAVANYESVATMEGGVSIVNSAMDAFGRLDILINNAGVMRDRMIYNMTEEDWDTVINVNLKGHFTVSRAASVVFREQSSGRIVNTSSTGGLGQRGLANYSAAKEGIIGLTRTLARDLGPFGVTVNAIRPAAHTRMAELNHLRKAAERSARGGDHWLLGSLGDVTNRLPEYVAPLVAWLCTDEAAHVNGRTFHVTGARISLFSEPVPIRTLFSPKGHWTLGELMSAMPAIIDGVELPGPPQM